jgi:hypothetical protein
LNHGRNLVRILIASWQPLIWQCAGKAFNMECPICRDLERAYDVELREYIEACSSAFYQISNKFAAAKHVDMERALYGLEEHRLLCAFAASVLAPSQERNTSTRVRQLAA